MIDKDISFACRRRKFLIAAKACSIGFRSGEYGGKNNSLHSVGHVEGIASVVVMHTYELHLQQALELLRHGEYCSCQVPRCFEDLDKGL